MTSCSNPPNIHQIQYNLIDCLFPPIEKQSDIIEWIKYLFDQYRSSYGYLPEETCQLFDFNLLKLNCITYYQYVLLFLIFQNEMIFESKQKISREHMSFIYFHLKRFLLYSTEMHISLHSWTEKDQKYISRNEYQRLENQFSSGMTKKDPLNPISLVWICMWQFSNLSNN